VPQATSAFFARLPDRRRWFALRLPSAFAGCGSPRGVPFPADPPPGSPCGVPCGAAGSGLATFSDGRGPRRILADPAGSLASDPPRGVPAARPALSRRSPRLLGARRTIPVALRGVNSAFPQVSV
jgi:hypothetical protein